MLLVCFVFSAGCFYWFSWVSIGVGLVSLGLQWKAGFGLLIGVVSDCLLLVSFLAWVWMHLFNSFYPSFGFCLLLLWILYRFAGLGLVWWGFFCLLA